MLLDAITGQIDTPHPGRQQGSGILSGPMSEEKLQVVRLFESLVRGDEPASLDLVDPNVVGIPLPDLPDFQTFHGHEGLLQAIDE